MHRIIISPYILIRQQIILIGSRYILMKTRNITKPQDLLITLYHYLQLRQISFDRFIAQAKLALAQNISSQQFEALIAKIMSKTSVTCVSVSDIFKGLKNKKGHLSVDGLRLAYFQAVDQRLKSNFKERSSSLKHSQMGLLSKSLQKFNASHEREDRVNRTERALDYIIGSSLIARRLKQALTDERECFTVKQQNLKSFLKQCHIKQLKDSSTFNAVLCNMYQVLTGPSSNKKNSKFYSQLLQFAAQLRNNQQAGLNKQQAGLNQQQAGLNNQQAGLNKQQGQRGRTLAPQSKTEKSQQRARLKSRSFSSNQKLQLVIRTVKALNVSQSREKEYVHQQQGSLENRDSKTKQQASFAENRELFLLQRQAAISKQEATSRLKSSRLTANAQEKAKAEARYQQVLAQFNRARSIQSKQSTKNQASLHAYTEKGRPILTQNLQMPKTQPHYFSQVRYSPLKTEKTLQHSMQSGRDSAEANQNVAQKWYPLASKYFRLKRAPDKYELPYFCQLEQLLSKGKIYKDSNAPLYRGEYQQASNLLQSPQYYVIKPRLGQDERRILMGPQCNHRFLAVLSTFAEKYPEQLSEMFLFRPNPAHYYCVKVFVGGQWKVVKTDDSFPANIHKTAMFSSSALAEIWAMLLEKVFAKMFKSYQNMLGGSLQQSLLLVCGVQGSSLATKQVAQCKQLQLLHRGAKVMLAYHSAPPSEQRHPKSSGWSKQEYFAVLSIEQQMGGEPLVKLRSTRGTKYSLSGRERQLLVNADVVTNYKLTQGIEKGCFYLSWQEFTTYFDSCFYGPTTTANIALVADPPHPSTPDR